MTDLITPFLEWLNANPHWAGLATFIISAAESVAIIGTVVPGSITMAAIGTLAGAGVIPLWSTLLWATLGAIVGDGISYWLGFYFKDRLRNMWPFKTNPNILEKGEEFVHKYGVMSVFIGRFVGPVRALVPMVAGMFGMKPWQFTIANVTSAIGWAPVYMAPGILLGAASLELPPDIALHVILVLMLLFFFIILCIWVAFKIFQLINYQTEQKLVSLWNNLKQSRYKGMTKLLRHHDPKKHHGQLTLAFYFLVTLFLFVGLVLYAYHVGANNILVNDALYHLFRGIRTDSADNYMLNITLLGQKEIILPVILTFFILLIFTKRTRVALHALALLLLAGGSVYLTKTFIHSERPWGIFYSPENFSMPSGHATLATTVYLGVAFLLASYLPKSRRFLIYFPAAMIVIAVGISRVYLGAHWFTDVIGAWLLGAAVLMITLLSFHRQYEKPLNLKLITLVCLPMLIISFSLFHYFYFHKISKNYAQLDWPTQEILLNDWWKKDESVPASRVSLFGFPSQNINLQWAADLHKIKSTLVQEGWTDPPTRDWITILHRMTDIRSTEYLPLISPQYLDRKPILLLVKRNGGNKLLVLRLWDSGRVIRETNAPLWVGTIGIVPRSYSWLFRKHHQISVNPSLIFGKPFATHPWQWRLLELKTPTTERYRILLIKESESKQRVRLTFTKRA